MASVLLLLAAAAALALGSDSNPGESRVMFGSGHCGSRVTVTEVDAHRRHYRWEERQTGTSDGR